MSTTSLLKLNIIYIDHNISIYYSMSLYVLYYCLDPLALFLLEKKSVDHGYNKKKFSYNPFRNCQTICLPKV